MNNVVWGGYVHSHHLQHILWSIFDKGSRLELYLSSDQLTTMGIKLT
jgi:hypothetical protein